MRSSSPAPPLTDRRAQDGPYFQKDGDEAGRGCWVLKPHVQSDQSALARTLTPSSSPSKNLATLLLLRPDRGRLDASPTSASVDLPQTTTNPGDPGQPRGSCLLRRGVSYQQGGAGSRSVVQPYRPEQGSATPLPGSKIPQPGPAPPDDVPGECSSPASFQGSEAWARKPTARSLTSHKHFGSRSSLLELREAHFRTQTNTSLLSISSKPHSSIPSSSVDVFLLPTLQRPALPETAVVVPRHGRGRSQRSRGWARDFPILPDSPALHQVHHLAHQGNTKHVPPDLSPWLDLGDTSPLPARPDTQGKPVSLVASDPFEEGAGAPGVPSGYSTPFHSSPKSLFPRYYSTIMRPIPSFSTGGGDFGDSRPYTDAGTGVDMSAASPLGRQEAQSRAVGAAPPLAPAAGAGVGKDLRPGSPILPKTDVSAANPTMGVNPILPKPSSGFLAPDSSPGHPADSGASVLAEVSTRVGVPVMVKVAGKGGREAGRDVRVLEQPDRSSHSAAAAAAMISKPPRKLSKLTTSSRSTKAAGLRLASVIGAPSISHYYMALFLLAEPFQHFLDSALQHQRKQKVRLQHQLLGVDAAHRHILLNIGEARQALSIPGPPHLGVILLLYHFSIRRSRHAHQLLNSHLRRKQILHPTSGSKKPPVQPPTKPTVSHPASAAASQPPTPGVTIPILMDRQGAAGPRLTGSGGVSTVVSVPEGDVATPTIAISATPVSSASVFTLPSTDPPPATVPAATTAAPSHQSGTRSLTSARLTIRSPLSGEPCMPSTLRSRSKSQDHRGLTKFQANLVPIVVDAALRTFVRGDREIPIQEADQLQLLRSPEISTARKRAYQTCRSVKLQFTGAPSRDGIVSSPPVKAVLKKLTGKGARDSVWERSGLAHSTEGAYDQHYFQNTVLATLLTLSKPSVLAQLVEPLSPSSRGATQTLPYQQALQSIAQSMLFQYPCALFRHLLAIHILTHLAHPIFVTQAAAPTLTPWLKAVSSLLYLYLALPLSSTDASFRSILRAYASLLYAKFKFHQTYSWLDGLYSSQYFFRQWLAKHWRKKTAPVAAKPPKTVLPPWPGWGRAAPRISGIGGEWGYVGKPFPWAWRQGC